MRNRFIVYLLILGLAACSSTGWKAPVVSRSGGPVTGAVPVTSASRPASSPVTDTLEEVQVESGTQARDIPTKSGIERIYRVRKGDTLYGISRSTGVPVSELIALNNLTAPYSLTTGQRLSLHSSMQNMENVTPMSTQSRYSDYSGQEKSDAIAGSASQTATASSPADKKKTRKVGGLSWQWPVEGKVIQTFDASDPAKRGIKIAGTTGIKITAAEAGEVVYSGDGLVGYGQLIIIKHNREYLSAYGHNNKRLVREGEHVQRGAVIATMGQLKDKPLLHFEIRRNGKPADPMGYLP